MLQTKYLFPILPKGELFHASTVKVDLNRHLTFLTEDTTDDVRAGLAKLWGTDTDEWSSVNVADTIKRLSTLIAVRVFFGKHLSHDDVFLEHTRKFSLFLTTGSGLLALFTPKVLAWLLGPLLFLPARYSAWRMNRKLIPVIKVRIAQMSSSPPIEPQLNDLLHYHIASALASTSAVDRLPRVMAARLSLILGFAAIPTTYLTMTNVLLNLASPITSSSPRFSPSPSPSSATSPPTLLALRTEASSVLGAAAAAGTTPNHQHQQGHWTRAALLSLPLADSFIKETLRLRPFGGIGLLHQVVAPDGVQLPRHPAITAPRGTWLAVAVGAVQRDEAVWGEAAGEFRPWRFVAGEGRGPGGCSSKLTSASETFLSWSLGRHVCPGRFFAAGVMRMVLAEVVMGYDVKVLEKRPEDVEIGSFLAPPEGVVIEVRRRREVDG